MKLYEITKEMRALDELFLNCIDEETGEVKDDGVIDILEQELQIQLQTKGAGIIKSFKNSEAMLNGVDEEIKRLQAFKKSISNQINSRKEYIVRNMEMMGITKIETELGRLKITDIKILNGVSYHPDGSRQEAFVITYEFTPKKSGIKTNTLFDETVIVTQNDKNPQPAVFFGGGVDQSVIDSVNKSVGIISEEEVGKPKTASSAYAVDPGRVDVLFGNKKTLYWVNKKE